jgi:flagellar biosynthesis protein FlhA
MQYVIKTCNSENTQELQNLLNEMSMNGWELYSMHEVETDDGIVCNCIFMSEMTDSDGGKNADTISISTFRSQMEKMLSPQRTPYEICLEYQSKIRSQQAKIAKIKEELEGELPANRKKLNEKISAGLQELEDLRQKLAQATSPDRMFSKLHEDKLAICLSEDILGYISAERGPSEEELVAETVKTRLKLTETLGFVIPKIIFRDDERLNPFEFSIRIRGIDVFKALVYPNHVMYYADEINLEKKSKDQIHCLDPLTGRKTVWLDRAKTKDFWEKGLSGSEYIALALEHIAVKHVDELLDYEELEKYVEVVTRQNAFLVENVIPDFISLADLRYILTGLVRERVSVKDIAYIFEKINDFAEDNAKSDLLKKIRIALSRQICMDNANEDGVITAFALSDKTLEAISPSYDDEDSTIVKISASSAEKLINKLNKKIKESNVEKTILIAPLELRQLIFTLLSHYISDITVLAREEIGCTCPVEILAEV